MRLFQRSFYRAEIPVKYSKGYNPLPRFSIASPLSLGIEGEEEYMDIDLLEEVEIDEFIYKMNKILPEDINIIDAIYVKPKESIAFLINYALYQVSFANNKKVHIDEMETIVDQWLSSDEILIRRLRKKGKRKVEVEENIIKLIKSIRIMEAGENIILEALLKVGENGNLRIFDFMHAFLRDNNFDDLDKDSISYKRSALYIKDKEGYKKPF